MAREVLTIAGTVVGAYFGFPQLGFIIGSAVGNAVDPVQIKGPSIGDAKLQNVQEGSPIPKVWGRAAIAGTVVDRGTPRIIKRKQSQGKGGPETVEERMLLSFAIAIAEPVESIIRIWENDKLVYDVTGSSLIESGAGIAGKFVFYDGSEDQLPDSTFEAIHGVGNAPAYRGVARVVFTDYDVTEKGQAIPRFLFEVAGAVTNTLVPAYILSAANGVAEIAPTPIGEWTAESTNGSSSTPLAVVRSVSTVVAIGTGGVCTTSTDLLTWTPRTTGTAQTINDCYPYGIGKLIAVGDNGAAIYSSDSGLNWTVRTTGVSDQLRGALVTGSRIIATGGNQRVITSDDDGATWTSRRFTGVGGFYQLDTDGTNIVVGANGGQAYRSTDNGVNWTKVLSAGGAMGNNNALACVYGDGKFILAGINGSAAISTNGGSSWASVSVGVSFGAGDGWVRARYIQGYFYLIGSNGAFARSINGQDWAVIDNPQVGIRDTKDFCWSGASGSTSTDPDKVPLSTIVTELHERAGQSSSDIDVSALTDEVTGFVYGSPYMIAEAIRALSRPYLFGMFAADLKIRYPKRGGASVFALTDDDLLEDPDVLERKQEIELPRKLHLQHQNFSQNYASVKATSVRISPDVRVVGESGIETTVVMDEAEAYNLVRKLHNVVWVELAGEFTVKIPARKWAWLTPTDCGTVTFRGITKRVLIQRIEEADGVMTLTVMHDRQSAYQSDATPPILRDPLPPVDDRIGTTYWQWLNIPALRDEDDRLVTYVGASGDGGGWAGALFQRSLDSGASYADKADLTGAIIGEVVTGIAAGNPNYTDDTNVLTVQLYNIADTLETISDTQLLQEFNAAIVGDEIIQFRDAVETTEGVWELSYLLRGRLSTTAAAHAAGERFVLLDGVSAITEGAGTLGQTFTHRAIGYGDSSENATVASEAWTPAMSQVEWAPEFLELTRDGSNVSATWVQRHRFGSAVNPVRSVNFEGYRVTIAGGGGSTTFDVGVTATGFDPVDTTSLGSPVTVTVAGLNRLTGESPLTAEESI